MPQTNLGGKVIKCKLVGKSAQTLKKIQLSWPS